MPVKNKGFIRLIKAFGYSLEGLAFAYRSEAAFRHDLALCAVGLPLAFFLGNNALERAVMILLAEIVNTALEVTINRISSDHHPLSKHVKDLGSATVFLALVNAAVTWGMILLG